MTAKQYFAANVQPSLAKTCGGCHSTGPAPVWIAAQDVEKSYELQFQRGYVWNREQVRGLMYSLYRKHPVGSLLVWLSTRRSM